jgi:hypothetical protein
VSSDPAVSEILSFILILGITALGITVFTAAVLPEMEKSAELSHENQLTESVLSLKTGIDKLWILGKCGMQSGTMFFPGSEKLMEGGTIQIKEGTKISFDHDDGEKTASLLFVSVTSAYRTLHQSEYILEGGAVFEEGTVFLPHSERDKSAALISFTGEEVMLSANCPVTIFYTYKSLESFSNVTNLTVSSSEIQGYWKNRLGSIDNLTLLNYEVRVEAVV